MPGHGNAGTGANMCQGQMVNVKLGNIKRNSNKHPTEIGLGGVPVGTGGLALSLLLKMRSVDFSGLPHAGLTCFAMSTSIQPTLQFQEPGTCPD